jgi:hypothetical protein
MFRGTVDRYFNILYVYYSSSLASMKRLGTKCHSSLSAVFSTLWHSIDISFRSTRCVPSAAHEAQAFMELKYYCRYLLLAYFWALALTSRVTILSHWLVGSNLLGSAESPNLLRWISDGAFFFILLSEHASKDPPDYLLSSRDKRSLQRATLAICSWRHFGHTASSPYWWLCLNVISKHASSPTNPPAHLVSQ